MRSEYDPQLLAQGQRGKYTKKLIDFKINDPIVVDGRPGIVILTEAYTRKVKFNDGSIESFDIDDLRLWNRLSKP